MAIPASFISKPVFNNATRSFDNGAGHQAPEKGDDQMQLSFQTPVNSDLTKDITSSITIERSGTNNAYYFTRYGNVVNLSINGSVFTSAPTSGKEYTLATLQTGLAPNKLIMDNRVGMGGNELYGKISIKADGSICCVPGSTQLNFYGFNATWIV